MIAGVRKSSEMRRPRRILIYGTHGIGKTSFGACAPKPIFVPTEDGFSSVNVDTFPIAKSFGDLMNNLQQVAEGDHGYESVWIDSADWAESLIWEQVCSDGGKKSIEEFGFGKGYGFAATYWGHVLSLLDACGQRNELGLGPAMLIGIIAHAKVTRFEDPATDPYDRYEPALYKSASAMLQEWADEVLFARQRVVTIARKEGSKTESRGLSSGDRVLYTTESPSHLAKNRANLPAELPLSFVSYYEAMQAGQAAIDAEADAVFSR